MYSMHYKKKFLKKRLNLKYHNKSYGNRGGVWGGCPLTVSKTERHRRSCLNHRVASLLIIQRINHTTKVLYFKQL